MLKSISKKTQFLFGISVCILFLTSCSDDDIDSTHQNGRSEYKIGSILNLSGRLASIGEPTKWALETYVELFNEKSTDIKLVLDLQDAGSDPDRAASALRSTLNNSADLIITSTSGTTNAILPYLNDFNGIVLANAGAPTILKRNENAILAFPSPEDEITEVVKIIGEKNAFLVRTSDLYHDLDATELKRRLGDRLVGDERYKPGNRDFSSIVSKIKSSSSDYIVLMGFGISYRAFFNEYLDKELNKTVIVDTDFSSNALEEYPNQIFENLAFICPDYISSITSSKNEFIERYENEHGTPPMYYAAILVDSLDILLESEVDKLNPQALIAKLNILKSTKKISGNIKIDNRQARLTLNTCKVNEKGLIEQY
ncbi:MAG: ABC transporter substrate-binding protein [Candidatus Thiodiazotropha sp. 6PDIVS]